MNSEEAEIRIALHVKIDVLLEVLDAPDEQGMVWCDGPYDLELPTTAPLPAATDDDGQWLIATLIGVAVGLIVAVVTVLLVAWSCYAALGVLLWLMVSSIT